MKEFSYEFYSRLLDRKSKPKSISQLKNEADNKARGCWLMQEDEYIAVKLSPNPDTKYKIFDSKNTLVTGNVFDISY